MKKTRLSVLRAFAGLSLETLGEHDLSMAVVKLVEDAREVLKPVKKKPKKVDPRQLEIPQ